MKVSPQTIKALGLIITGDGGNSPYRSGPQLVEFFNQYGFEESYGQGFPSRWYYAEDKLNQLNETDILPEVFKAALDPRTFLGNDHDLDSIANDLNEYLKFDGYHLSKRGAFFVVCEVIDGLVKFGTPSGQEADINAAFISEQIEKCERKIKDKVLDGAITNARS
ncbi:hypothetical protein H8D57_01040, partial [bacterium]|nr:hypothetical protein [bacterium]